jgi:hypothetical protein
MRYFVLICSDSPAFKSFGDFFVILNEEEDKARVRCEFNDTNWSMTAWRPRDKGFYKFIEIPAAEAVLKFNL